MAFSTFRRRDGQRFRKVYPRIRKTPRYFTISDEQMSVESTKVGVVNDSSGTYNFTLSYTSIPTVSLSAELGSDSQGMVNVFVSYVDVDSFLNMLIPTFVKDVSPPHTSFNEI